VELLLGIFEHFVAQEHYNAVLGPLLQVMLVCRRWKVRALPHIRKQLINVRQDIAVPLLYRYLYFKSSASLNKAAAACLSASERGDDVAQWIYSLSLGMAATTPQEINSLFIIVAHASRLRILKLHGFEGLPSSLLAVMSKSSISETLTSLHMFCSPDHPFLRHCSRFHNLEELHMEIRNGSSDHLMAPNPPSLYLPALKRLVWMNHFAVSAFNAHDCLMTSRFPVLRSLAVGRSITPMGGNRSLIERATVFFQAHSELEKVEILYDENLAVPLVPLITAHHLALTSVPSPSASAIIPTLQSCVKVLSLSIDGVEEWKVSWNASFFDLLDAVSCAQTGLREVRVSARISRPFSWAAKARSNEDVLFMDKMLVYAQRLGERGVYVFDQDHRCAQGMDAFKPSLLSSRH
jgi:hypothetical protein